MLFAVATMDPTVKMFFFGVAVALFVFGAIGYTWGKVSLVSAGLAAFVFPAFWDALAQS